MFSGMPRKRIRKSQRGVEASVMSDAGQHVLNGGSIRAVSRRHGIPYATLRRFVSKLRDPNAITPARAGYGFSNRVFSVEQEDRLEEYLKQAAAMYFGLTQTDFRQLAFEFARRKGLKFPKKSGKWKHKPEGSGSSDL